MRTLLSLVATCATLLAIGQNDKRALTAKDFETWEHVKSYVLSQDGNWVGYEVKAEKRDGMLYLENPESGKKITVPRGTRLQFSGSADAVAFTIKCQRDTLRKLQLAKKKKSELPKDSMGIYVPSKDTLMKMSDIKSFAFGEDEGSWLVIHKEKVKPKKPEKSPEADTAKKKKKKKKKKGNDPAPKKKRKVTKKGTELVIMNPQSGDAKSFKDVNGYKISDNGKMVAFYSTRKDSLDSTTVVVFRTDQMKIDTIYNGPGITKTIALDKAGTQMAMLHTVDTGKVKIYGLYYWNKGEARRIADEASASVKNGWCVSEHSKLYFSDNGERLFFGTAPKPDPYVKDTMLASEKYSVDIWSYNDDWLMTKQLKNLKRLQKRTFLAVYHIASDQLVQLGDSVTRSVQVLDHNNGAKALAVDLDKYAKMSAYDVSAGSDYYLMDVQSGERRMILEKQGFSTELSPNAKYLLWWDSEKQTWMSKDLSSDLVVDISSAIGQPMYNIEHDLPMDAWSYGVAFWSENDEHVYLYDKYDIWKCDPKGIAKPVNITKVGRKGPMSFRYLKLDPEELFVKNDAEILLKCVSEDTKSESIYRYKMDEGNEPEKIFGGEFSIPRIRKAKKANVYVLRKMRFDMYPELEYAKGDLTKQKKLTSLGDQMTAFHWGTVDLFEWKLPNGKMETGMLYKPDGFDPKKKYPMIVYYYEKLSQTLHAFQTPGPSRSTINRSEYVSNGYLVFVPDIAYETGHPGASATDAIVSGTKHLIKQGFVDEKKIGLQGQSWGGYQTAFVVTRTNMFAAAMSGAPVSNMTSAYGGIRWESGRVRQFQYEQTQSRLGKTLWDKGGLDLYIENSPVFFVDKIETPMMIMHNDADGAVPWYQGIEYFNAFRRLNKPCWMVVYNKEAHNLLKWPNRMDLNIRMKQFFDHYLMDKPAPRWMVDGLPAVRKGKEHRYELTK